MDVSKLYHHQNSVASQGLASKIHESGHGSLSTLERDDDNKERQLKCLKIFAIREWNITPNFLWFFSIILSLANKN